MSSEMKRLLAMFFGIVLLSAVLGALGMFVYSGLLTGTGTFLAAPLAFLTATQLAATITFSVSMGLCIFSSLILIQCIAFVIGKGFTIEKEKVFKYIFAMLLISALWSGSGLAVLANGSGFSSLWVSIVAMPLLHCLIFGGCIAGIVICCAIVKKISYPVYDAFRIMLFSEFVPRFVNPKKFRMFSYQAEHHPFFRAPFKSVRFLGINIRSYSSAKNLLFIILISFTAILLYPGFYFSGLFSGIGVTSVLGGIGVTVLAAFMIVPILLGIIAKGITLYCKQDKDFDEDEGATDKINKLARSVLGNEVKSWLGGSYHVMGSAQLPSSQDGVRRRCCAGRSRAFMARSHQYVEPVGQPQLGEAFKIWATSTTKASKDTSVRKSRA